MWDCRDGACFFVPHKTGRRYSDYIVEWDEWDKSDKAVPIRVSCAVAIRLLDECWEVFKHAGNVPGIAERLDCQSVMGLRSMFPHIQLQLRVGVRRSGKCQAMVFRIHRGG